MSRAAREKVNGLPEKLLALRLATGLTQKEVLNFINVNKTGHRSLISHFEKGKAEPSLSQILGYTRLANTYPHKFSHKIFIVDDFIDENRELFK